MMKELDDPIVGEGTRGQGLMVVLVAGIVFAAFEYFGGTGRARTALVSTATVLVAIIMFWPLRRYLWFWLTIALLTAVHVGAILWLPLSGEAFDGFRIAPIALLDIAVTYLIIFSIAKFKNLDRDRKLPREDGNAGDLR